MTATAATTAIPRRRAQPSVDIGTLALGTPIIIGHGAHATAIDSAPWAAAGDRLIVGGGGGALATVEVTNVRPGGDVLRVLRVSGELAPGEVLAMRAPVWRGDLRALVRRARLALVGAP